MVWKSVAAGVAIAALTGCASNSRAGRFANYKPNLITRAEIVDSHASDALTAVRRLRGEFLSNRGRTSISLPTPMLPVVYLDQMQLGSFDALATIPANDIAEIRLYRSWEASYKFGKDKTAGVIQVITYIPAPFVDSTTKDSPRTSDRAPVLGWPPR